MRRRARLPPEPFSDLGGPVCKAALQPPKRDQDMTSITLRKLALAGAAVASLGIAACSKPAATNDTNTTDNTATATDNAMTSDNTMSSGSNMTSDTTTSNNTAS